MYKLTQWAFITAVNKAKTEEDVKYAYSSRQHDLYTTQILFEFKFDKKFQNKKILAEILAQALCYVHKLKYGITDKKIPRLICLWVVRK